MPANEFLTETPKIKQTKKLFYGKWPYRVSICGPQWTVFVRLNKGFKISMSNGLFTSEKGNLKQEIDKFSNELLPFLSRDLQVRNEFYWLNLYLKDDSLLNEIVDKLEQWIIDITKPLTLDEKEFLLNNNHRKIICKEYPYKKYRYKIYINRKAKTNVRENFKKWISNYEEKVRFPYSTEEWLDSIYSYHNPFFYVEDQKLVSMILLYLGEHHAKTEEFILESSINN